jgi:hypothetical protein
MLNVIRDNADNDDGGISGELVGYFVAKNPTSPIKKVFPTEDADAMIIDSIGDVIMCTTQRIKLLDPKRITRSEISMNPNLCSMYVGTVGTY